MNVNKKLGRLKQWAGERMGGEIKTTTSDDFKALESEMALRHDGMEKLQRSMTAYVKSISKRAEGEDREKTLPVGYLGSVMVSHGEDFEPDSDFGNCLSSFGRAHERIARVQEQYVHQASSSWLDAIERSMVQMKEYQSSRRKLEQRRLAYDTSLSKMQKAKKEDFRVEEELRNQKAKYEESSDEVYRRMQDIRESEADSIADLTDFLEAELAYHEKCREILLNLKRDWPAAEQRQIAKSRSRSNTAHRYDERYNPPVEEEPVAESRATIPRLPSRNLSPPRDRASPIRPSPGRSSTFEGPTRIQRDRSPAPSLSRTPTDSSSILAGRASLRPVTSRNTDVFNDEYEDSYGDGRSSYRDPSPAPSHRSASRNPSFSAESGGRKGPPPPPPSRAKKPPPPPPPMKRSALSATDVHR